MQAWMGDEPHLNTMMSANYQEIGAGVASDGESTYYTVDTAKPSNVPVAYTPEALVESGSASGYIIPVKAATPWVDGSIYHDVQSGQSLWAVSEAYGVDVDEIRRLNARQGSDNIYIGESLLIRPAFTVDAAAAHRDFPAGDGHARGRQRTPKLRLLKERPPHWKKSGISASGWCCRW